jgi:hypothetical protein
MKRENKTSGGISEHCRPWQNQISKTSRLEFCRFPQHMSPVFVQND